MKFLRTIVLIIALSGVAAQAYAVKRTMGIFLDPNQVYVGGKLGVGVPITFGKGVDDVGFNDVASPGFTGSLTGLWMQSRTVGIGAELGYASYPYKEQFWSALNYRGSFDATYRDFHLGVNGHLILGTKALKPYFGVNLAVHYLRNTLDYKASDVFAGSDQDDSVNYVYGKVDIGCGGEGGIYYKLSPKACLTIAVRLNIVPTVRGEVMTTIDPYTFVEKEVAVNPHGNQNNVAFVVGLNFATRKRVVTRF